MNINQLLICLEKTTLFFEIFKKLNLNDSWVIKLIYADSRYPNDCIQIERWVRQEVRPGACNWIAIRILDNMSICVNVCGKITNHETTDSAFVEINNAVQSFEMIEIIEK